MSQTNSRWPILWLAAVAIAPSCAPAQTAATTFDGHWAVSLTCEDCGTSSREKGLPRLRASPLPFLRQG